MKKLIKGTMPCIIIYLLSALLTWHGIRIRYTKYLTDQNPEFIDIVEVFFPVYNSVFALFVIAEKLTVCGAKPPNANKFFDIEER